MYDDLVATLRRQCVEMSCGNCNICVNRQAADAIEELSRENQSLAKSVNEASEVLRRRWIPVERLPEPKFAREWYLVALKSGCVKTLAFEKEERTDNLFRHGWHETASPVTHWMPLPEPPEEET